jgi:hypothetical protein
MDQHFRLGSLYRSHYLDQLHFLPRLLNPSFVSLSTSPVDRCVRSAICFLLGLYPPQDANEVLAIETATESTSDLMVSGVTCPELGQARTAFGNSPQAAQFAAEMYPRVQAALDALGLDGSWASLSALSQWAIAFNCSQNAPTPGWLTDDVMQVCQRAQAFDQFDTFANASRGFYGSYVMRHIIRDADRQLGSANGKKIALVGTHDTSLSAVLSTLGYSDVHIPLYASHIAIEYWKTQTGIVIRFVFNGSPVVIDLFNQSVVPFDDFRTVIQPFLTSCPEVDSWELY